MPEFEPIYDEHMQDMDDELLLHLLFADLRRFIVAAQLEGRCELVERALRTVERIFVNGDELTDNLVAVSFVEDLLVENEPGESEVVERFPPALAEEAQRQRAW